MLPSKQYPWLIALIKSGVLQLALRYTVPIIFFYKRLPALIIDPPVVLAYLVLVIPFPLFMSRVYPRIMHN